MSKTFHTYVKEYQHITPDRLYGEHRQHSMSVFTTQSASIYFIVKCVSAAWLPHTFKARGDYCIEGTASIDGSKTKVAVDMSEFWFAHPELKPHFPTARVMADYFMQRTDRLPWRLLSNDLRYRMLTKVDAELSTRDKLVIGCQLACNITMEDSVNADVYLYQAINYFGLPAPKLDVVYIGSSVSNPFERLSKHEKWGRILSEKRPDEDIFVYFAELDGDIIRQHTVHPLNLTFVLRDTHRLDRRAETLATEMALINHFKPIYNDRHVTRHIKNSKLIRERLMKRGYTDVNVEVILEGSMGKLGSPYVGTYGAHVAHYPIT